MEIIIGAFSVALLVVSVLIVLGILLQEDKTGGGMGILGGSSQSFFGASSKQLFGQSNFNPACNFYYFWNCFVDSLFNSDN